MGERARGGLVDLRRLALPLFALTFLLAFLARRDLPAETLTRYRVLRRTVLTLIVFVGVRSSTFASPLPIKSSTTASPPRASMLWSRKHGNSVGPSSK